MDEYQDVIDEWWYHTRGKHHCYYEESDEGNGDCPSFYTLDEWLEFNGVPPEPVEEEEDMNYPDDNNPVKSWMEAVSEATDTPWDAYRGPQKPIEVPTINRQPEVDNYLDPRDFIIERLDTIVERLIRIEDALAEPPAGRSEAPVEEEDYSITDSLTDGMHYLTEAVNILTDRVTALEINQRGR